jgi:hypothetical protein
MGPTKLHWKTEEGELLNKVVFSSSSSVTVEQASHRGKLDSLVKELIEIGEDGSISGSGLGKTRKGADGRNERAMEIGAEIDEIGGEEMMQDARRRVKHKLGFLAALELEAVWGGIGTWQALALTVAGLAPPHPSPLATRYPLPAQRRTPLAQSLHAAHIGQRRTRRR